MGKKGWFSAVKKAIRPSFSKVKRSHKSKSNPKKSWHGNQMNLDTFSCHTEAAVANPSHHYPSKEDVTKLKQPENEQIIHVDSISYVREISDDAASDAVAEVNSSPQFLGKSTEEIGAIKIQTAYRGYQARRTFRPLKARRRLNMLMKGLSVKRQTASSLMCIQTMARVQSQVRSRRIKMAEVNEALQRQLLQRHKKELDDLRSSKTFDLSPKSKEQVEANLQSKKEASERRERALAYAYSRQQPWRNSSKSANPTFMDPNYLDWGWNWTERWNGIRPWETTSTSNNASAGDVGTRVSHHSPPSKASSVLSPRSKSTKPMNAGSRISSPGPSPLGSGKKGGTNTGSGVGPTKKRHLVMISPPSGNSRYAVSSRKNSKTVR